VLGTTPLTAADWAVIAGFSVAPLAAIELVKLAWAVRERGRRAPRP
jgi:hypothetical protein